MKLLHIIVLLFVCVIGAYVAVSIVSAGPVGNAQLATYPDRGVLIWTDRETGCQYITNGYSFYPRMDSNGQAMCRLVHDLSK